MCHFLAPAGQPEMMHKNFMLWPLRIFVVQRSCMKFYTHRPCKQPVGISKIPKREGRRMP